MSPTFDGPCLQLSALPHCYTAMDHPSIWGSCIVGEVIRSCSGVATYIPHKSVLNPREKTDLTLTICLCRLCLCTLWQWLVHACTIERLTICVACQAASTISFTQSQTILSTLAYIGTRTSKLSVAYTQVWRCEKHCLLVWQSIRW